MSFAALMLLPLLASSAFALPIDVSLGLGDYGYDSYGGIGVGLGGGVGLGLGGGIGLGLGGGTGAGQTGNSGIGVGLGAGIGAGLAGNGGIGVGLGAGIGAGLSGNGGIGAGLAGYDTGVAGYRGWPFDTYGPLLSNGILDFANPLAYSADVYARTPVDYAYAGYPRTVDYARGNFVRGLNYGATEFGTRDEVTVRPSFLRAPYSRFYSSYFPYSYYGINRYPFYGGYYMPRASLLGRIAGDTLYLKR